MATPKGCQWKTIMGRSVMIKNDGTICGGNVPKSWQGKRLQDEPWKELKYIFLDDWDARLLIGRYSSFPLYEGRLTPVNNWIETKEKLEFLVSPKRKETWIHRGSPILVHEEADITIHVGWGTKPKGKLELYTIILEYKNRRKLTVNVKEAKRVARKWLNEIRKHV